MSMLTLTVGLHCSEQDPTYIHLYIDCRIQCLTSPSKGLIFTAVYIGGFWNVHQWLFLVPLEGGIGSI